jgi:hypothetical protein
MENTQKYTYNFNFKSALCVYGEHAKQRKKPEQIDLYPLILDQNQQILKSMFYTSDRIEWSKKPSHATDSLTPKQV